MADEKKQKPLLPRWLMRPQMLVGLSALLLSLCGLFISIYEASLIRQSQRATTWPYVEIGASLNAGRVTIWVENTGVGPARIQAGAVTYKGEVQEDWQQLMHNIAGETADSVDIYKSLINGRVLPANSDREAIFAITKNSAPEGKMIVLLQRAIRSGDLDISVCYSSVYDECWQSRLQNVIGRTRDVETTEGTREIESCAAEKRSKI